MDEKPNILKRFLRELRAAWFLVFGDVRWSAPPWLRFIKEKLAPLSRRAVDGGGRSAGRVRAWLDADPKRKKGVLALLLLVVVGGVGGYVWYLKHPPPDKFTLWVEAPALTPLEDVIKPHPLKVNFSGSAAKLDQIGRTKPIKQGITMSPALDGTWYWENDHQLAFHPKADWGVGQDYVVKFDSALFPRHVRLETYSVDFKSAAFTAVFEKAEFYQDPKKPKLKQIVATLKFSHPVDTKDLERRITMQLAGERSPRKFTVSYDKLKGEAYLKSNELAIPPKDTDFLVTIDKGVHAAAGGPAVNEKLERHVNVPGMFTYFRIGETSLTLVRNEQYEPEQVLVIETTADAEQKEIEKNLSLYLLPIDRPKGAGTPYSKKHYWADTAEIGPEVLAKAKKITLAPIPTEHEADRLHTFKYEAPVGRALYLQIKKGVRSYGDYILAENYDRVLRVPEFPKELNIMHEGSLLSLSGEKKLSVISRDVDAVRFEVGRVIPSEINHLVSQTAGSFMKPNFRNYNFNADNVTEVFHEVRKLKKLANGKTQYTSFDFTNYLAQGQKRGLFFFKVESWDIENKVATDKADERFVLVTDLGVLVKDAKDGSHDVFVQSIFTGKPVVGAQVEVLGKNGIGVLNATSTAEGQVAFPKLEDFQREKEPVAYVIRKGNDLSFIPYGRADRKLNFSRFETGGVYTTTESDSLNAYLFSDRGIYRPGDEFHVAMVVKPPDWSVTLKDVPLEAVVQDPRGLEIYKKKFRLSPAGFEELSYTTEDVSPTGNYTVSLYIVKDGQRASLLGDTTVRVEEFLPDRLRIVSHLSKERLEGWVSPEELKGRVSLQNLFGTPAEERKVVASVSLSPGYPAFRKYKDFTFIDPLKTEKSFSDNLEASKTDAKGEAEFDLGLEKYEKATYRLRFVVEGFEAEGGRAVTTESAVLVSPLEFLVGYKADGALSYLKKDSAHAVDLIAVDPSLKQVAVGNLKAHLIDIRYVSVLTKQSDGTYKYQSVRKETTVSKDAMGIKEKGNKFTLPTDKPGTFALLVRDESDTILNRIEYTVVGESNATRSLEKNAELQVTLSAPDYSPGDEIEMEIKAPYVGAGLITIEREKVYAVKWFETTSTSSVQRIRVPKNLEGNGYVNVAFIRNAHSKEIFMSPLSYGVVPFSVSRARRVNKVTLTTPDLARPGEAFRIKYQTQNPGKIVIFAVDEGILQVAKYQTPDPLAHFFKKRALEVTTSQILDLILPEFALVNRSSPGGDGDGGAIGKNLNPFKRKRDKPIAYWSGILETDGSPGSVTYDVPDYFNGTLSVFAVAVSQDSIGVERKKSIVRGPFVISPNVPTFVAPGDEFEVSAGIANGVEGSGAGPKITMELEAGDAIEVVGGAKQEIVIPESRESVVKYKLRARAKLGSVRLNFKASLGDKKSKLGVELSVRPAVPFRTTMTSGWLQKDSVEVPTPRRMYKEFRKLEVSVSQLPLALARGLLLYLDNYPYGCTEQMVSRAFPALVLRNRPEFGYAPKRVDQTMRETLNVLRGRQNEEGAFGFWAANSHVSPLHATYAMHFLIEAKDKGVAVPPEMLSKGYTYLETLAAGEPEDLAGLRNAAYATYLLTRGGKVTTNYLTTLRKKLEDAHKKTWRADLAGIYLAATYKLLQKDGEAYGIIKGSRLGDAVTEDYVNFYDGLARDGQYLYLVARHFPDRLKEITGDELQAIVAPVAAGRYNSLSSAYTILGIDAYSRALSTQDFKVDIIELLKDKQSALAVGGGLFPRVDFSDAAEKMKIVDKSPFALFYGVVQAGFDLALPAKAVTEKLEVQRELRDAKGNVLTSVGIGEQVEVHIKVRSIDGGGTHHLALVDLLPGGFEPVIDSLRPPAPPPAEEAPPAEEPPPQEDGRDSVEPPQEYESGADARPMRRSTMHAEAGAKTPDARKVVESTPNVQLTPFTPEYIDIREDRVVLYGAAASDAREFVYSVRATNRGDYVVPPLFGESMYDRRVQALGMGGKITVKGE